MRTFFVTGVAGAGTSSVAGALAVRAAQEHARVVLVRCDPGAPPVAGLPAHVEAVEVDALSWGSAALESAAVLRRLAGPTVGGLGPADVVPLPGLTELAWWAAMRDVRRSGADAVVVDAGPLTGALQWMILPETVVGLLARTWPLEQRTSSAALEGDHPWHLQALAALENEAADLAALIRSHATALHIVTRPAAHDLRRALDALAPLALFELPVTDLIVNRVSGRRSYDAAAVAGLTQALPAVRVRTAAERRTVPAPPGLAAEIYGDGPIGGRAARPKLRRSGAAYTWHWPMPFVDPSRIEASTAGDQAMIRVGPVRRIVTLPSVLRRCRMVGAAAATDGLDLLFEPDPGLWPAHWEVS